MTATEQIIGQKMDQINQALRMEEEKVKELRVVERILAEILEGQDIRPQTQRTGRAETLKEVVRGTLVDAGRPISISEIEQAAKERKGVVRKQGLYSTLHEMVKHKEAKRVRPGIYL